MAEEKEPSLADLGPEFAEALARKSSDEDFKKTKESDSWKAFLKALDKAPLSKEQKEMILEDATKQRLTEPKWTGSQLPEPTQAFREQFEKVKPYVGDISPDTGQALAAAAGAGAGYKLNPPLKGALGAPGGMPPGGMPPRMPPGMPQAPQMGMPAGQMPRPVAGGPAGPVGGPAGPAGGPAAPMGAPARGYGTFNYGLSQGLGEIEAGRALDMTKQQGGVHDLLAQRREAMNRIQSAFPTEMYTERPSGLMVPDQGAGKGPKASFVQPPQAASGMTQLPPRAPIPPANPAPSPLNQVQQLFSNIGKTSANLLTSALKSRPVGALAGASAGYQGFEALKNLYEGNMEEAALSGMGALGSGLAMIPTVPTALIGGGLSVAPYLYRKAKEGPSPVSGEMSGVVAP